MKPAVKAQILENLKLLKLAAVIANLESCIRHAREAGLDRRLQESFFKFKGYHNFTPRFCTPGQDHEKGGVEGLVGYAWRNYMVPVPQVRELQQLNEQLSERCREELGRRLRGKNGTKGELLAEDEAAFLPLPAGSFDACRKESTFANSLSLVRFDCNDYSVPVRSGPSPGRGEGIHRPGGGLLQRHSGRLARPAVGQGGGLFRAPALSGASGEKARGV